MKVFTVNEEEDNHITLTFSCYYCTVFYNITWICGKKLFAFVFLFVKKMPSEPELHAVRRISLVPKLRVWKKNASGTLTACLQRRMSAVHEQHAWKENDSKTLKWQSNETFCLWFFHESIPPVAPDSIINSISEGFSALASNSRKYSRFLIDSPLFL